MNGSYLWWGSGGQHGAQTTREGGEPRGTLYRATAIPALLLQNLRNFLRGFLHAAANDVAANTNLQ